MIYNTLDKPSDAMNLSFRELNEMAREQEMELINKEEEKIKLAESKKELEAAEWQDHCINYISEMYKESDDRYEFLDKVKSSLLSECLCKLYYDSCECLTESEKTIARNLINKFIVENDVNELLNNFATKNLLLSEFARITTKYYDKVVESCDCEDSTHGTSKEFVFDDTIKDDFFSELKEVDTYEASKLIKDRVAEAIEQFITDNQEQKLEYRDIIDSAKKQMELAKNESFKEEISDRAELAINELRERRVNNVFHCMVESLSKNSFKDKDLMTRYVNEATLNMNIIVEDCQLIYTMLEMVNTTEMVNVNESFIKEYIESLS